MPRNDTRANGSILSADFSHVTFKSVSGDGTRRYAAHLRRADPQALQVYPHDELDHHIIASRSFACFPPVDNMHINLLTATTPSLSLNNPLGVTVYDIQCGIAKEYESSVNDQT